MRSPSIRIQSVLTGVGLAAGFLLMASVFVPDLSRAAPEHASPPPIDPAADLAPLGSIEGRTYRIEIYGSVEEPLYSVFDAATGETMGGLLTEQEVADFFPRLDLSGMDFGIEGAIMRAEPETRPY